MVSSPVTDLLNESNTTEDSCDTTFEEENTLRNAHGKTLEIYRFIDDGVVMASVNGFKLPLTSLREMLGDDPLEDDTLMVACSAFVLCSVICVTSLFFAFIGPKV